MNLFRRIFPYLALIAILLVAHWSATRGHFRGPMPPLQGLSLDGRSITLQPPGEPTLIYFWATWCGVCRAVHGSVADIAKDYPVVAIAIQSGPPAQVTRSVKKHPFGGRTTVLVDPDGVLAQLLGVRGVPTFFFVNRKGEIVSSTAGYTTEVGLRLRLFLADKG